MYRSNRIIVLFMFIAIFGCNDKKKSDSKLKIRKWYYEDGTLKKEMEYLNDSIPHGLYRYYYPSGVLQDSAHILYNKFHGKRFEYYENSNPYIITSYFNGNERSGVNYRRDGSLNEYITANYATDIVFIIRYDSLGKMKNHEGFPIFSWVQEVAYPIGEEFSVELLVADPPNSITEVNISDWNIDRQEAENELTYTPDEFNRVIYSRKQSPEKDLYILQIVSIEDTITQTSLTDTLVIIVDKNGKSFHSRKHPVDPSLSK